jgi:ribosomal protein L16 Arg81 hydroxylase
MEEVFQKYPDFRTAYENRIEVEVHAGESIFIPPFVWHYVVTDELCMNFYFHNLWMYIYSFFNFSALAMNFFTDMNEDYSSLHYRNNAYRLHEMLYSLLGEVPPKYADHFLNELEHLFIK